MTQLFENNLDKFKHVGTYGCRTRGQKGRIAICAFEQ